MNHKNDPTLSFVMDKKHRAVFYPILQQGFNVSVTVGCSLKQLICDQFGVQPGYLLNRITTIFLNGKPVDNVDSARIDDGSVLALSAAMPGLVGATFRTGGALSGFRSSITHHTDTKKIDTPSKGMITLKLFNLLVSEMGPAFLEKGFWVENRVVCDLIESKKTEMVTLFKSISLNNSKDMSGVINGLKAFEEKQPVQIIVMD